MAFFFEKIIDGSLHTSAPLGFLDGQSPPRTPRKSSFQLLSTHPPSPEKANSCASLKGRKVEEKQLKLSRGANLEAYIVILGFAAWGQAFSVPSSSTLVFLARSVLSLQVGTGTPAASILLESPIPDSDILHRYFGPDWLPETGYSNLVLEGKQGPAVQFWRQNQHHCWKMDSPISSTHFSGMHTTKVEIFIAQAGKIQKRIIWVSYPERDLR